MEHYVLYTTHCPKCRILQKKLNDKSIDFQVCEDVQKMKQLNINSVPTLSYNGNMMSFYDAIKFVNQK